MRPNRNVVTGRTGLWKSWRLALLQLLLGQWLMAQEEVEKGSWATGSVGRHSGGLGRDSHASGTCIVLTLITFVHISSSPMDCFETGTKKALCMPFFPMPSVTGSPTPLRNRLRFFLTLFSLAVYLENSSCCPLPSLLISVPSEFWLS